MARGAGRRRAAAAAVCLGALGGCASPGGPGESFTLDQCREIVASADKPGTVEDAARRRSERTCRNMLPTGPKRAASGASTG